MTTINLRDGLEALYYFGEQDFNPQRNQLQDHSGYGRHATANGSVTIGNSGINSFESASLTPSSNDYFYNGMSDTVFPNEITIACLFRKDGSIDDKANIAGTQNDNNPDGDRIRWNTYDDGRIEYFVPTINSPNDNGNNVTYSAVDENKWYFAVGRYNGNQQTLHVNGELVDKEVVERDPKGYSPFYIGKSENGKGTFNGKIALIGAWSRAVSISEIDYMNDLTAPRRSML